MFFERAEKGEQALLVHIDFLSVDEGEDFDEFLALALSAGVDVCAVEKVKRQTAVAKTLIGKGKLEELVAIVKQHSINLALFNCSLSPSQERNLEKVLECRVVDRTGLILDIFSQRARSHEGKLQVELAQLQHLSTRLVRGWTHLERQKGGIGLRGPGETQLETDRRLIRLRIKSLLKRLEKVQKQREQSRRSRQKAAIPSVSIVGYTNAGKSTLFNALTQADSYAADQLFATLDPTLRKIELQSVGTVILADTVGFVKHLPHKLIEAFKSTLEETVMADVLVHVVDCASEERDDNIRQVEAVLEEIGATGQKQLFVYNKIDLLGTVEPQIDYDDKALPVRVWLSARTGQGLPLLLEALATLIGPEYWQKTLCLSPQQSQLRAQLFALKVVEKESFNPQGHSVLQVNLPMVKRFQIEKRLAVKLEQYVLE